MRGAILVIAVVFILHPEQYFVVRDAVSGPALF